MGTAPAECGKGRYDTADPKRCLQPMLAWPGLWLSETARTVALFTGGAAGSGCVECWYH